jgi:hypothetical protein
MRKIRAAEAETTAPVDEMAESAATTENKPTRDDGTVQTPPDLVGQQGPRLPPFHSMTSHEVRCSPAR